MPEQLRAEMSDSLLLTATTTLLKNRPHHVTYSDLEKLSGVPEAWIKAFGQGRMSNPSVVRVEKLYNALAPTPLELPNEL